MTQDAIEKGDTVELVRDTLNHVAGTKAIAITAGEDKALVLADHRYNHFTVPVNSLKLVSKPSILEKRYRMFMEEQGFDKGVITGKRQGFEVAQEALENAKVQARI